VLVDLRKAEYNAIRQHGLLNYQPLLQKLLSRSG